jgi:hypothetical protein
MKGDKDRMMVKEEREEDRNDIRDKSIFVDWFLSFSFWCFYPHLSSERNCERSERLSELCEQ